MAHKYVFHLVFNESTRKASMPLHNKNNLNKPRESAKRTDLIISPI